MRLKNRHRRGHSIYIPDVLVGFGLAFLATQVGLAQPVIEILEDMIRGEPLEGR